MVTRRTSTLKQEYPRRDHGSSRCQLLHRSHSPPCHLPISLHPTLYSYFILLQRYLWIAFSSTMARTTPGRTYSTVMARQSNSWDLGTTQFTTKVHSCSPGSQKAPPETLTFVVQCIPGGLADLQWSVACRLGTKCTKVFRKTDIRTKLS